MHGPLRLRAPYLLFLGDAEFDAQAKTAFGLVQWVPERCLAQLRLDGCRVRLDLPEMSPEEAADAGARSLVIGIAPVGGGIPAGWETILRRAARAGLDIVSGMHTPLGEVPGLSTAARDGRAALVDVRLDGTRFPTATGRRRRGKRLLTVGTDCALGKKYTALALTRGMQARGIAADFRATGQTGIMIAGGGVAIDAVPSDFAAGAAEALSPDAPDDHWDVIEGQGSLFHPAYAGVTLSLLHGSQPDVLVLAHDPARPHLHSFPAFPVPDLESAAGLYVQMARLTNPDARLGAVSLNTAALDERARQHALEETAGRLGVPCFDPLRSPLDAALDAILRPV